MSTTIIVNSSHPRVQEITIAANLPGEAVNDLLATTQADYLLLPIAGSAIMLGARTIERLVQLADDTGAALVYSDFREVNEKGETSDHPLIDYQLGSIRDNFDFGSVLLISRTAALAALVTHSTIPGELQWGGLYDLRLKLSIDGEILRVPEPLYTRISHKGLCEAVPEAATH